MKLTLLVAEAGSTASVPGESRNRLRAVLPPKTDRVDDQNKDVFGTTSDKNTIVEIHGATDEAMAGFKAGQRVTVTIEVAQ